jgi:rod shape determining protein RodA
MTLHMKQSARMNPLFKLFVLDWRLVALLAALCAVGITLLYSAGRADCANQFRCLIKYGSWHPWAASQLPKMLVGFLVLVLVAVVDLKYWVKYAYYVYGIAIFALVLVIFVGHTGLGAQRWLNLGFIRFQPSEMMKVGMVLALAKYFAGLSINEIRSGYYLLFPAALVLVPTILVALQPDLGTALSLVIVAGIVCFIAGVQWWKFAVIFMVAALSFPFVWKYGLHGYQRERVVIFLNPERDSMGSGYHITQSKITIGSGGLSGKGYLEGTQSHLNFLPEKQTDFVFTMLAEEFGLLGCLGLFALVMGVLWRCYFIAFASRNPFGRLLSLGLATNFFVYFALNTAMVMGLLPVVGVPSPLLSYGGTSVLTILFGFGLVECCYVHSDMLVSTKSSYI